jgi:hypothetical protein
LNTCGRGEVIETKEGFCELLIDPTLQLLVGNNVFGKWAILRNQSYLAYRAPAGEYKVPSLDVLRDIFPRPFL